MTDARRIKCLHQRPVSQPDGRAHVRAFNQQLHLRLIEHAGQMSFLFRERDSGAGVMQYMPATIEPAEKRQHCNEPVLDRPGCEWLTGAMFFLQVDQKTSQV
jgi:hypothetical protein